MAIRNGYVMTHEYAGSKPVIQSRHRTLQAARREMARDKRIFYVRYPYPRAFYPSEIRELIDGEVGGVVVESED